MIKGGLLCKQTKQLIKQLTAQADKSDRGRRFIVGIGDPSCEARGKLFNLKPRSFVSSLIISFMKNLSNEDIIEARIKNDYLSLKLNTTVEKG